MRRLLSCALALTASACFVDESANPDWCESQADCDPGEVCEDNFCLPGEEDAGTDMGMADLGEPTDAGADDMTIVDAGDDDDDLGPLDFGPRDFGPPGDSGPPPCGDFVDGCPEDRVCCGAPGEETCVDPMNNEMFCGAAGTCGTECAGDQACCDGVCADPSSAACLCPGGCGAGETCCDGRCTNTDTDPDACGASCMACADGELCCGGSCVAAGAGNCGGCGVSCGADEVCCGIAGCKDLDEPATCGSCTNRCSLGAQCFDRMCCGGEAAPTFRICGSACVDTDTDRDNCGTCGNECDDGVAGIGREFCIAGRCE